MDWLNFAERTEVSYSPNRRETRQLSGTPYRVGTSKIVLNAVASSGNAALASYRETRTCPHFTLAVKERKVLQHIPISLAAPIIGRSFAVKSAHLEGQVIFVGVCKNIGNTMSGEDAMWVGEQIGHIAQAVGVPYVVDSFLPANIRIERFSFRGWQEFSGICGVSRVPGFLNIGPGEIALGDFLRGLNGVRPISKKAPVVESPAEPVLPVIAEPVPVEPTKKTTVLGAFRGDPIKFGDTDKRVDRLRKALGLGPGGYDDTLLDAILGFSNADDLGLGYDDAWSFGRTAWKAIDKILVENNESG